MQLALPTAASSRIERVALGSLAGFVAFAALVAASALPGRNAVGAALDLGLARLLGLLVLALLLVSFTLYFALIATGSFPRERRARALTGLALATLAAAIWPKTFFSSLPDALQDPRVYYAIGLVTLSLFAAALALVIPRRERAWALGGLAALGAHVAIRLGLVLGPGGPYASDADGWSAVAAGALAFGLGLLAVALARAAGRP